MEVGDLLSKKTSINQQGHGDSRETPSQRCIRFFPIFLQPSFSLNFQSSLTNWLRLRRQSAATKKKPQQASSLPYYSLAETKWSKTGLQLHVVRWVPPKRKPHRRCDFFRFWPRGGEEQEKGKVICKRVRGKWEEGKRYPHCLPPSFNLFGWLLLSIDQLPIFLPSNVQLVPGEKLS